VALAIGRVARDGLPLEVVLLGGPGDSGPVAECWRSVFHSHGCSDLLRFTGVQRLQRVAGELAAVDLVVFPERAGPDSRRGTLAAALAAGKPVIALDGPERWEPFVVERALVLVEPSADALEAQLVRLRDDSYLRAEQAARAGAFYNQHMSVEVAVKRLVAALPALAPERGRPLLATEAS
jgi:glycosyltransferase involved in cell wall biosynthesis